MLKSVNSDRAQDILEETKIDAMNRFSYYKMLSEKDSIGDIF